MQALEFNHEDFTRQGSREADKGLLVKFFIKARPDSEKTLLEGRPVFKDVEYVDIKIPGNRNAGACRPATQDDKNRFPAHYRAFKDRVNDAPMEGTPLAEWSLISRSMAEELAFCHVKTVEQLATMADAQASRFMGLMPMREKAKLWLENSKKEKPMWEMDQKIRRQAEEIEELKRAIGRLVDTQTAKPDENANERQVARAKKEALLDAQKLAV